MKISIYNLVRWGLTVSNGRQFAVIPEEPEKRKGIAGFLADVRVRYAERKKNEPPNDKRFRPAPVWYFVVTVVFMLLMQNLVASPHVEIIGYSEFKSLVKKDLVKDLVIHEAIIDGSLKGAAVKEIFSPEKLKEMPPEVLAGEKLFHFETVRVEDPSLTADLEAAKIPFRGEVNSNWLPTILSWVVPVGLFFLLWVYLGKKMGSATGGLMQIGKSKAKVYIEKKTGVTFADVAGIDEAEAEVAEVVGFLKDPDKYQRLGGRIPKGVLHRGTAWHR